MSALMEMLKQKKAALASNRRAKTVKPEEGRSRWRILPSWRKDAAGNFAADGQFYHDFGQHFVKDAAGEVKAVYICADKTFGKPCDVCAAVEHAIKATTDDAMVEMLKGTRATGRILMNALRVDGPNPTEPGILEVPPTVFENIASIIMEWGVETLDLAAGKDIIIERTGKGKNTKYSVQIAAKSAPVAPDVMKKIADLDEYVAQENEEQMNRALTNLRVVAGLLPASAGTPSAAKPAAAPSLTDMTIDEADAELVALEMGMTTATTAATTAATAIPVVTEAVAATVSVAPAAPVPTVAVTAAPAAPAAPAASADNELDELLKSLG